MPGCTGIIPGCGGIIPGCACGQPGCCIPGCQAGGICAGEGGA
jgi:hypothetical protein